VAKILIIGGGICGCFAAHLLSEKGHKTTLVEKAPLLGGGVRTFVHGGHPFTYGPRHFLTREEPLFDFLNKYVPMRKIPEHEFLTYVERDSEFYHYPIHNDEIDGMPDGKKIRDELKNVRVGEPKNLEEYWEGAIGPTLYSKFVDGYSKKMWKVESNREIDDFSWSPKGVAIKTGPKAAWTEAISAYPIAQNGYDDYFDISTAKTDVHLKTAIEKYDVEKSRVMIENEWHTYDFIVNTISPENILNNAFGPLRWLGRDFLKIVLPVKEALPPNVYFVYYANTEPFTRIVEYKKLYRNESNSTLLGLEIPSFSNKLYPYPMKKDQEHAQKYLDALPKNVFSVGRHGSYQYRLEISGTLKQCMEVAEKV
jgi:UDP-galactopyranose mutase